MDLSSGSTQTPAQPCRSKRLKRGEDKTPHAPRKFQVEQPTQLEVPDNDCQRSDSGDDTDIREIEEEFSLTERVSLYFENAKVHSNKKKRKFLNYVERIVAQTYKALNKDILPLSIEYRDNYLRALTEILQIYERQVERKERLGRSTTPMSAFSAQLTKRDNFIMPHSPITESTSAFGMGLDRGRAPQDPLVTSDKGHAYDYTSHHDDEFINTDEGSRKLPKDNDEYYQVRRSHKWKDRIAYQRMRESDLVTSQTTRIKDQGVVFLGHRAYDGHPKSDDVNDSTYCRWGEGESFEQIQTQGATEASLVNTRQKKGKGKQKDPLFLRSESEERPSDEETIGVHFAGSNDRRSDPHTANSSYRGRGGLPLGMAGQSRRWGGNPPDPDGSNSSSEDERNPYLPGGKGTQSSSTGSTKTKETNRSYKTRILKQL
jgi:hypothetical protein